VKIPGDEGTLPYVGQVLLLNVPREDEVIVDSEDLQSAFNLFEMPPGWRGLFCYEKKVPGTCVGLGTDEPTYVALKTVPMGWLSAVGIVQAAIRHLAFKEAGLPLAQELQKNQPLPDGDRFLLYLDSVDQLRVVSKSMAAVLRGESSNGEWYSGPPALRDAAHVMGLPHLKGADAAKVRRGNRMALRSIKRRADLMDKGAYFAFEHPYGSWVWYCKQMVELAARKGVYMAVFSHCCYGGRRKKWTSILTNSRALYEALHKPDCDHEDLDDYQPYFYGDRIVYPTEEEAEYPWELCVAMAEAMRGSMTDMGLWKLKETENRRVAITNELQKYHRAADPGVMERLVSKILEVEGQMQRGKEEEHIEWLFRQVHYRGTDIRLLTSEGNKEMVPYPALNWYWKECLSFKWTQESHINVLEAQALFTHLRRVVKGHSEKGVGVRLIFVVDSQVIFYAVSKGRSPSTRLNRILRRLMALQLAADVYVYPLWTISAWNYADVPSRR